MKTAISWSQLALAWALLIFLLLHTFGVNALQATTSPIVGFSINPTHPHYATIRENGLLEITDYQTSAVIGSYLIPLPFQDINNLDPTGLNVGTIAYSPNGAQIAVSVSETI